MNHATWGRALASRVSRPLNDDYRLCRVTMESRASDPAHERARGALLGLAWGDVLGCPVEGWRAVEIARHFSAYETLPHAYPPSILELSERRRRRLRPLGLHSDDTQQALALLGVVLDPTGWSTTAWVDWLVAGAEAHAWRGTGENFDAAVAALRQGVAPQRSGASSAGLGAAMRAGPLGAVFARPEQLATVVMEASLVTHRDLRAAAMAYAVAETVRRLVSGENAREVLDRLPSRVRGVEDAWLQAADWAVHSNAEHAVSTALEVLCLEPPTDLATLGKYVSQLARPFLTPRADVRPNQGFALLGGIHGLAAALLGEPEPGARLAAVVGKGDDTDTVGAICGTVLGARHGDGWIPTDRLADRSRLEQWADALADGGPPPETRAAFMRREAELTAWERSFQRQRT